MKHLLLLLSLTAPAIRTPAQFTIMTPGVPVNIVEDIKTDTNGHTVFGTDNGVLVYSGSLWQHFGLADGLSYLDVKAIGTYPGGFFYSTVNNRIGNCNYVTAGDRLFSTADSFNFISAINANNTGDTLYGTDSGQVFLNNLSGYLPFGPLGYVTDIGQLHNASGSVDFHAITTTNKAVIYQISTGYGILVSTTTTPIPSNNVLSHAVQNATTYGGTDSGLFIVDFTYYPTLSITIINTANAPILSDTISAVAVKDSMIFIGTPKGLSIFARDAWQNYDTTNSNLPANAIARLAVDTGGLWIGTRGGHICRFGFSQLTGVQKNIKPADAFAVYPNPADDYVLISTNGINDIKFSLYDANGRKVLEQPVDANEKIDLHAYAAGVYFYIISNEAGLQLCDGQLVVRR